MQSPEDCSRAALPTGDLRRDRRSERVGQEGAASNGGLCHWVQWRCGRPGSGQILAGRSCHSHQKFSNGQDYPDMRFMLHGHERSREKVTADGATGVLPGLVAQSRHPSDLGENSNSSSLSCEFSCSSHIFHPYRMLTMSIYPCCNAHLFLCC